MVIVGEVGKCIRRSKGCFGQSGLVARVKLSPLRQLTSLPADQILVCAAQYNAVQCMNR
jgi:hypothetical protein